MPTVKECTILAERLKEIKDTSDEHYAEVVGSLQEMKDDLSNHIVLFSRQETDNALRYAGFVDSQNKQSEAISALSVATQESADNIKSLVNILTTGRTLGKLGKWLLAMTGFFLSYEWFTKYWGGS